MKKPHATPAITADEVDRMCEDREVPPLLRGPLEDAVAFFNEAVAGQTPCMTWQEWLEPIRNPPTPLGVLGAYPDHGGRVVHALAKLHLAITAIENFDPKDHYSKAVDRVAQGMRSRGKGGRKPLVSAETIAAWLERRGYQQSDVKKAIVREAIERFAVSEATVRAAASAAGLTRAKGSSRAKARSI